jgi:hypothetical protein
MVSSDAKLPLKLAHAAGHGPSLMPPPTVNQATTTTSTCLSSSQPAVSYTILEGGTAATAVAPGDIILTERFLDDSCWPPKLVLNLGKSNWPRWRRQMEILAAGQGFSRYLDGSLPCPDPALYPGANWIWDNNDRSLRAAILNHVSVDDYDIVDPLWKNGAAAFAIFKALQSRHERHAQVCTLIKALNVRFDPAKDLNDTVKELRGLHCTIIRMGPIDDDTLLSVLLINALGVHFPHLQSSIQSMARMTNFSSAVVLQQIQEQQKQQGR